MRVCESRDVKGPAAFWSTEWEWGTWARRSAIDREDIITLVTKLTTAPAYNGSNTDPFSHAPKALVHGMKASASHDTRQPVSLIPAVARTHESATGSTPLCYGRWTCVWLVFPSLPVARLPVRQTDALRFDCSWRLCATRSQNICKHKDQTGIDSPPTSASAGIHHTHCASTECSTLYQRGSRVL